MVCDDTGDDATKRANISGQVAVPLLAAGGVSIAGGLVGLMVSDDDEAISPALWSLGATGLAASEVGLGFGIAGRARENQLRDDCAPRCSPNDVATVQRYYAVADASFGAGAAALGAVAAVMGAWLSKPHDEDPLPIRATADGIKVSF